MKLDLRKLKLRKVNETLQSIDLKRNNKSYTILNPEGNHAICAGLTEDIDVTVKGSVGILWGGKKQKGKYYS